MATTQVQIFVREFETLTGAHVLAGQLSADGIRWIDISATARGAWVCGRFSETERMAPDAIERLVSKFDLELISVDEPSMKAMLSLGSKPQASTKMVGIVEGKEIAAVIRTAVFYSEQGMQILEIRIKRAGLVPGAYAFFALAAPTKSESPTGILPMIEVPLVGDYRRFFL